MLPAAPPLLPLLGLALALGLGAGHAIGARRARRTRRELQRALGARSLELLAARAEQTRLLGRLGRAPRRERLLRLVLVRLREARAEERRCFIENAVLRLQAVEAAERARKAGALARRSAARVRELELEAAASATGTITTRAAKSYGNGEAVTVSVVDHETPEARLDGASRVPHRERARFARLTSSNETRRPGAGELGLIEGLAIADEHRLNDLGIHDLEQLARLSEGEQRRLHRRIVASLGPRPLGDWIGDARALLESRAPV